MESIFEELKKITFRLRKIVFPEDLHKKLPFLPKQGYFDIAESLERWRNFVLATIYPSPRCQGNSNSSETLTAEKLST